jgi:hypothetical protein
MRHVLDQLLGFTAALTVLASFSMKTAIEGITDSVHNRGEHVRTFRNALGIDD